MIKLKLGSKILLSAGVSALLTSIAALIVHSNVKTMIDAQQWVSHTDKVIARFEGLLGLMVDMETGQRGYLMSGDEGFLEPYKKGIEKFEVSLKSLQETVSDNPVQVKRLEEAHALHKQWVEGPNREEVAARKFYDSKKLSQTEFEDLLKKGKGKAVMDAFRKIIADAVEMEKGLNEKRKLASAQTGRSTLNWVVFGLSGALLIGFILLWKTIASAIQNLRKISAALLESSTKVTQSAEETSSASQELSAAATQQAASLQETVSSLQQISAMVQKTLESATSSAQISDQSEQSAKTGQDAIGDMTQSMIKINEANGLVMEQTQRSNAEIGEIIKVITEIGTKTKVINDIVFQTKLLSFNASVEAARAGEHGKGFAVVAEEVGNLAHMSGNAAKEITTLLDQSIHTVEQIVKDNQEKVTAQLDLSKSRIAEGESVAQRCLEALTSISQLIGQSAQMTREISQASKEQASGIGQISTAMEQIDRTTHNNSTAAAQTAKLSEDLAQQAGIVANAVKGLQEMVDGDTTESKQDHSLVQFRTGAVTERKAA